MATYTIVEVNSFDIPTLLSCFSRFANEEELLSWKRDHGHTSMAKNQGIKPKIG